MARRRGHEGGVHRRKLRFDRGRRWLHPNSNSTGQEVPRPSGTSHASKCNVTPGTAEHFASVDGQVPMMKRELAGAQHGTCL